MAQVVPLRGTSAPGCHALISTGSVALSSGRVVHLVRSVFGMMLEMSRFVHSLHISWYTIPILYNSYAEEIPPLFQPPMLHFQVVGISCASCCSRSVLRFLKLGGVVKPAFPVEDFMDHGHVRLVPPLAQCL